MVLIFYITYLAWFMAEIFLNRYFRSGSEDIKDRDKGSLRIIWITIGMANSLALLSAIFIRFPVSSSAMLPYSGLFMILSGMVLRFFAIGTLGRFFTVDVTIRQGHSLKMDGLYRYIRHPSYSGMLISFYGFGLSLNNWLSLAFADIPVTMVMIYRINIEERLLEKQFGDEYAAYKKRSWRLIPWIF